MSFSKIPEPDFAPLVLKKKTAAQHGHVERVVPKTTTGVALHSLEDESVKLPMPTYDLGKQIRDARGKKGWTQQQLDRACSFPAGTTSKYESGSSDTPVVQSQLIAIGKQLGIRLERPKPKLFLDQQ